MDHQNSVTLMKTTKMTLLSKFSLFCVYFNVPTLVENVEDLQMLYGLDLFIFIYIKLNVKATIYNKSSELNESGIITKFKLFNMHVMSSHCRKCKTYTASKAFSKTF